MSMSFLLSTTTDSIGPVSANHKWMLVTYNDSPGNVDITEEIRKSSSESWAFRTTANWGTPVPATYGYNVRTWSSNASIGWDLVATTSAMYVTDGPDSYRYHAEDSVTTLLSVGSGFTQGWNYTGWKTASVSLTAQVSPYTYNGELGWYDSHVHWFELSNTDSKNNGTVQFGHNQTLWDDVTLPDPWGTAVTSPTLVGAYTPQTGTTTVNSLAGPPSAGRVRVYLISWLSTVDPVSGPSNWTTLESGTWGGGSYKYLLVGAHYDDSPTTGSFAFGSTQTSQMLLAEFDHLPSSRWYDGDAFYVNAPASTQDATTARFRAANASTNHGALVAFNSLAADAGTTFEYSANAGNDPDYATTESSANGTSISGIVGGRPYSASPSEANDDVLVVEGANGYYALEVGIVLSQDGVSVEHTADATATDTHTSTATAEVIRNADVTQAIISGIGPPTFADAANQPGADLGVCRVGDFDGTYWVLGSAWSSIVVATSPDGPWTQYYIDFATYGGDSTAVPWVKFVPGGGTGSTDIWVAVIRQHLYTATDPTGTWTQETSWSTYWATCQPAWDGTTLAWGGSAGRVLSTTDIQSGSVTATSTNQVSWPVAEIATDGSDRWIVTYGTAGTNAIRYADGVTNSWTYVSGVVSTSYISGALYKDGRFIVGGSDGKAAYSDDGGETWTETTYPYSGTAILSNLKTNGDIIVASVAAAGVTNTFWSADNGGNWSALQQLDKPGSTVYGAEKWLAGEGNDVVWGWDGAVATISPGIIAAPTTTFLVGGPPVFTAASSQP